jgi:hypothetical protein
MHHAPADKDWWSVFQHVGLDELEASRHMYRKRCLYPRLSAGSVDVGEVAGILEVV